MKQDSVIERAGESFFAHRLENAIRYWEASTQADRSKTARLFTIALSGEAGTRETAVAQEVGRLLSWHVYDQELLEQIAQDMGVRTRLLESVDEREQSWIVEMMTTVVSSSPEPADEAPQVTQSSYVHHLVKTVLALGTHGKCVIVGRGAAFILADATTLRVRLVAPVRERVTALARQLGIPEREAESRVSTIDRERTDFVQKHFRKDPADPRNYDLVLNAARLSVAQQAKLIVEALDAIEHPSA